MGRHVDISGHRNGRLVVVCRAAKGTTERGWLCLCDCGTYVWKKKSEVYGGFTKSCGCWYEEYNRNKSVYGANNHRPIPGVDGARIHLPEYSVWRGMKQRCFNTRSKAYGNYGGRGITICERWLTFENFLEDMGRRPSADHEIDRKNNNGNYEPGNCHWIPGKFQARNTRKNPIVEYLSVRMPISDWADFFGLPPKKLYQQISRVGSNTAITRNVIEKCVFVADQGSIVPDDFLQSCKENYYLVNGYRVTTKALASFFGVKLGTMHPQIRNKGVDGAIQFYEEKTGLSVKDFKP